MESSHRQQSLKRKAQSFALADGRPLEFKDYTKAVTKSSSVFRDIPRDDEEILNEISSKKRKMADELKNAKIERDYKRANKVKNDSINSNGNSELTSSSVQDEDDIEWSDCEAEISRNMSILEQSTSTVAPDKKKHSTPIKASTSNGISVNSNNTDRRQSTNSTTLDDDNRPSSTQDTDDGETDWDDTDEAEFLREVDSFERSFNDSSISRLDRSALQEISNLSRQDQL